MGARDQESEHTHPCHFLILFCSFCPAKCVEGPGDDEPLQIPTHPVPGVLEPPLWP